jgi:haloalkane dehalogenase
VWQAFRRVVAEVEHLDVGRLVAGGCRRPMPDHVRAAYDAPFPDESFKAGVRAFPGLIPQSPDDPASAPNRRAWERLAAFDKPFLTAFSDSDPITAGADRKMREVIPGAQGRPHAVIKGAGHFLQEDAGPELAAVVLGFARETGARVQPG